MSCVFCDIVSGAIPSRAAYEDKHVYAFYDIEPKAPIHILFVPKTHTMDSAADIGDDQAALAGHLLVCVAKVAAELNISSYRVVSNVGDDAGQTVPHLHFHLLAGKTMPNMV